MVKIYNMLRVAVVYLASTIAPSTLSVSNRKERRINNQSSFDGEHFLRRVFLWLERSIDRQHSLWLLPRVRTSRFDLQRLL